jgi:hypothetical protein
LRWLSTSTEDEFEFDEMGTRNSELGTVNGEP